MKILLQDNVFGKQSKTNMAQIVRYHLFDLMTITQIDRYFTTKRVWWDSSIARREKSVIKGMVFEGELEVNE